MICHHLSIFTKLSTMLLRLISGEAKKNQPTKQVLFNWVLCYDFHISFLNSRGLSLSAAGT